MSDSEGAAAAAAPGEAGSAQAFHPGVAAAAPQGGRPRKPKCPGRADRKRRDRGHGVDAPRVCKGKVLSCCGFCKAHCECAPAFCGLVLVLGSKLVSCDAAGLPFGMVSEPRRRLKPTLAGSFVECLAVKMYFRVSGRVSP